MDQSEENITKIVTAVVQDLQLETDFRLSSRQQALLQLNRQVNISHACFAPFARRAQQYLTVTSEDDRHWTCYQDLASLDYIICLLP